MSTVNRLAKLRAMPLREILFRAGYEGYTFWERTRYRRGRLALPDRLRHALIPGLRRASDWHERVLQASAPARFFRSVDDHGRLRTVFAERYAGELRSSREVGNRAAAGDLNFFGRQFSFGAEIDWHADPVTGATWPRRYHRDMPVHGGDVGFGDAKDVWEVNRHQFFIDIAKVAFLDRSVAHADALGRLLRHWMREVPYATGAPWACALEPAFRAWSWLWAYHLVRAGDVLDDETHRLWLTGFFDHGRFLYRHLERYSSPYNHLIGEASALFALGLLFPQFSEAPRWRERGRQVLESTVGAQFHADGGTVEQSTFYHHATLGFYLLSLVLARRNGVDLSPEVWSAVERALAFSAALVQPDGRVPRIGGADDGKPIRMEHLPFWDFRPYYAIGAVLFSRRDFRFAARRFWEDALWVLGPEGAEAFDRLEPVEPPRAAAFASSGYYVVRSDWSDSADYVCFDCGEQAAGLRRDDVPSAAHGHADCLSVVAALGGREVLVDPGFFCYNGDPAWEVYFRKTAAHNTIVIDSRDQARHLSKMAWARTYEAQPEGWAPDVPLAWARGSHDGYVRAARGVIHRRTTWLRPGSYLVIYDELTGTGAHTATAVLQFAPGTLQLDGAGALFDNRFEVRWASSEPIVPDAVCGGDMPSGGWIATSLGVRAPAPRLTLTLPLTGPRAAVLTVVADRHRHRGSGPRIVPGVTSPAQPLHLSVSCEGGVDDVIADPGGISTTEIESDAPLIVARRHDGVVSEILHAGGTYASVKHTGLAEAGCVKQTSGCA